MKESKGKTHQSFAFWNLNHSQSRRKRQLWTQLNRLCLCKVGSSLFSLLLTERRAHVENPPAIEHQIQIRLL